MLRIDKILAHALVAIATALSAASSAAGQDDDAISSARSVPSRTVTGRVLLPSGAPAAHAMVVTSAGGRAPTARDGSFALAIDVARGARSVQLTAVANGNLSASALVALGPSAVTDSGTLVLAATTSCALSWLPTFGESPGPDNDVECLAVFDDGSGPALYAGGDFRNAGGVAASYVAKWNGSTWAPVGTGMNGGVRALAVFDDGSGAALYAGGWFNAVSGVAAVGIAKWNGARWTPLASGLDSSVWALAVFDDGSGPVLYAGGDFTTAGEVNTVSYIAKWDGSTWSPLGTGRSDRVRALIVYDDGGGPALYAGGDFKFGNHIAKWDGVRWSALGPRGVGGSGSFWVDALAGFDDGTGPALYAGGTFTTAGGSPAAYIARWKGASWSPLGSGMNIAANAEVRALSVFDDGSGPALYVGGSFTTVGGAASNIAKWDGASWTPLGSGITARVNSIDGVHALATFDDGTGAALYAGGRFSNAGGMVVRNFAKWSGASWSSFASGVCGDVDALAVFDDGTGAALYAGGSFFGAGGIPLSSIAKWNGTHWSPLGSGIDGSVSALAVFDDGTGQALYAGGSFTTAGGVAASSIAKWNGATWASLGSGMNYAIYSLTVFDDGSGPALYAGGSFTTAGGVVASGIAKWNGTTWSPLGSGTGVVYALTSFDDGSGPALYAGGSFTTLGGMIASFVAKWNGTNWSPLASGTNRDVYALTVFDDGSGAALYAGGVFNKAGGGTATSIAKWNGTVWSPVGGGMSGWVGAFAYVYALAVFDDGTGPALYVGGLFPAANGIAANDIAKWDGAGWSPLGTGIVASPPFAPTLASSVRALTVFDDGSGPALFVSGDFAASPAGDSYVAKWGCSLPAGARTYGTSSPGCAGTLAIGVTSSPQVGNAAFAITCTNAPPLASGVLLAGTALTTSMPILGLEIWVNPIPLLCTNVASDNTGNATIPVPIRQVPALAGVQVDVQIVWLGPTAPPPCPPIGLSASNALELTVQP